MGFWRTGKNCVETTLQPTKSELGCLWPQFPLGGHPELVKGMNDGATKGGMGVSSQTVPETRLCQHCLAWTLRQLGMALLFLSFGESLARESLNPPLLPPAPGASGTRHVHLK